MSGNPVSFIVLSAELKGITFDAISKTTGEPVPVTLNASLFLKNKNAFLNTSEVKNNPLNVIPYSLCIKSKILATLTAGNNSV